jgi:integrase
MDRDKLEGTLRRTAPKPLTVPAIAGMKVGTTLADGHIRPGHGSLKVRKRKTARGHVTEWLFIWHREGGKAATMSLRHPYSASAAPGFLTLEGARIEARKLQDMVKAGTDPLAQRELSREATTASQRAAVVAVREAADKTLGAMLKVYTEGLEGNGKERSAYDAANLFANHVEKAFPEVYAMPAGAVSPGHISMILARLVGPSVEAKKGRTALKLRSYMGAAFRHAMGAATDPMAGAAASGFGVTSNPAAAVQATRMAEAFNRPGKRTLTRDELRHYLRYVATLPALPRIALQLQLATAGQRMLQLLRLEDANVTADTITLYDAKGRRSQARAHVLPAVAEITEAVAALRELRAERTGEPTGELFASRKGTVSAAALSATVQEISIAMVAAREAATPFRGGDIRRTVETMLSERLGISKDTRAQLLSHGLSGVQDAVYDKGQHLESKRNALRSWNDYLADLCIGPD